MPRPKAEITLVRKVAQAFLAVGQLQRAGRNTTRGYDFTRASDVLAAVRDKLLSQNVLIHINESDPQYVPVTMTNGNEQITECRLPVTYTFLDEKSELKPMRFNGIGRDVEDKSLAKAQTGAQKSLLKRFGLMVEDADEYDGDRDAEEDPIAAAEENAPRRIPKREQPIRKFEIRALQDAFADTQKTDAEVLEAMLVRFKVAKLCDLKRWQFKDALAWASNGAGTLAPAPKPQAAPALQGNLPLPKPAPSFEMRVGGKTVEVQAKTGSYSI